MYGRALDCASSVERLLATIIICIVEGDEEVKIGFTGQTG